MSFLKFETGLEKSGLHLCVGILHVFAGGEDVLHQLDVVEHQRQPEGFWVPVELAENVEGTLEQGRVLRLRNVAHAAGGIENVGLC